MSELWLVLTWDNWHIFGLCKNKKQQLSIGFSRILFSSVFKSLHNDNFHWVKFFHIPFDDLDWFPKSSRGTSGRWHINSRSWHILFQWNQNARTCQSLEQLKLYFGRALPLWTQPWGKILQNYFCLHKREITPPFSAYAQPLMLVFLGFFLNDVFQAVHDDNLYRALHVCTGISHFGTRFTDIDFFFFKEKSF